jgi:hypothetical protein
MNENDLRDCFAMFAMLGLISRASVWESEEVWEIADAVIEARKVNEEGIVAIKKRVNRKVKNGTD